MEPEQRFWSWFAANSARFLKSETDVSTLSDELAAALRRVRRGLTFELSRKFDYGRELIISADGIKDRFPAVQKLVAAAPDLDGWRIVAFRQRGGTNLIVEFSGYRLDPEDVWFKVVADKKKVGLYLLLPQASQACERTTGMASFILLDHALGEYDVEMKLGFIECLPLPSRGLSSNGTENRNKERRLLGPLVGNAQGSQLTPLHRL